LNLNNAILVEGDSELSYSVIKGLNPIIYLNPDLYENFILNNDGVIQMYNSQNV
jgi:hypothetical protein